MFWGAGVTVAIKFNRFWISDGAITYMVLLLVNLRRNIFLFLVTYRAYIMNVYYRLLILLFSKRVNFRLKCNFRGLVKCLIGSAFFLYLWTIGRIGYIWNVWRLMENRNSWHLHFAFNLEKASQLLHGDLFSWLVILINMLDEYSPNIPIR